MKSMATRAIATLGTRERTAKLVSECEKRVCSCPGCGGFLEHLLILFGYSIVASFVGGPYLLVIEMLSLFGYFTWRIIRNPQS